MKMSKWFHEKTTLCGDTIEDSEFSYAVMSCEYLIDGVDAGDAICHAINNHDRMVDEISELQAALELMILQFESDHNCEYEYKVIKLSKNLLAKLNQEGEG
ncbi:hypothetical protein NVP1007O_10 [Vibrio phage 1.007.O._10N.261.55.F9]|nr:hypothetical protein NVP1007O_10 [Vibrio phage 1.007.O._10N.261.55.F9]